MIGAVAAFSETGPRHGNEDGYAFWWAGDTCFAVVADGLGGMGGGAHASSHVVDFVRARARHAGISATSLAAVVQASHGSLQVLQRCRAEDRWMATTLTVIGLRGERLVAAHCGDTRLYRVGDAGVTQLSEDHTEAQRLFKEGRLAQDQIADYPRRHILESAVGIEGRPVIQEISGSVSAGDWLVLASDGAHGLLEPSDLAEVAAESNTPRQFSAACRAIIEARGPRDNYTMLVMRVGGNNLHDMLRRALPWSRSGGNVPYCTR